MIPMPRLAACSALALLACAALVHPTLAQVAPDPTRRAPVQISPLDPNAPAAYPSSQPPRSNRLNGTGSAAPRGAGQAAPNSMNVDAARENQILSGRPAIQPVPQPSDGRIVVDAEFCRQFSQIHVPGGDVAVQPGIDASGRAVAPADLGGGAPVPRTSTDISVADNQRQRRDYVGQTYAGSVTLDANGRPLLNGRPMTDDSMQMAQLCRTQGFN